MAELQRIPIHRSLNRPNLLAGCERELILVSGMIAGTLVVVAMAWVTALVGVLFWLGIVTVLRQMAKADPMMSKVYLRHIRYKAFYPTHATAWADGARWVREK